MNNSNFYFNIDEFFVGCTSLEREQFWTKMPKVYRTNLLHIAYLINFLRKSFHMPIVVNSCYRDTVHNKRVGGVPTSQHISASAIDFYVLDNVKNVRVRPDGVCDRIQELFKYNNLHFGQLIAYPSFVHMSLPTSKHFDQFINKMIS